MLSVGVVPGVNVAPGVGVTIDLVGVMPAVGVDRGVVAVGVID